MTGILEKFENVQIRNRRCLSEEDQTFCEMQQLLYDKTRIHYLHMFSEMETLYGQELAFWGRLNGLKEEAKKDVYEKTFCHISRKEQKDIILNIHQTFIQNIISHFNVKYGLKLDCRSWQNYIPLEEPKEPNVPYGWRTLSPEERETYKKARTLYEEKCSEYTTHIIHSHLSYDAVIDEIFVYLGGFSFQEKAEKEIKEEVHENLRHTQYNVQSKKLSFYGLTPSHVGLWKTYEISLGGDAYRAVLRALTFYDSQKESIKIYQKWMDRFLTAPYSKMGEKNGIYTEQEAYGNRILRFKYFKNGRWDILFDTGAHALEFAREYLDYGKAA